TIIAVGTARTRVSHQPTARARYASTHRPTNSRVVLASCQMLRPSTEERYGARIAFQSMRSAASAAREDVVMAGKDTGSSASRARGGTDRPGDGEAEDLLALLEDHVDRDPLRRESVEVGLQLGADHPHSLHPGGDAIVVAGGLEAQDG